LIAGDWPDGADPGTALETDGSNMKSKAFPGDGFRKVSTRGTGTSALQ
jgi:hypothetical protein